MKLLRSVDPPPEAPVAPFPDPTSRVRTLTGPPSGWRLATFAGRLGEVCGGDSCSSLTLVFRLVLEAQGEGQPVAWITRRESTFFPPDAALSGVDLEALAVVWVVDSNQAARATDHLLRSGSFGLVVLDLGSQARMPIAVQTRLVGLARKHSTALLCITEPGGRGPAGAGEGTGVLGSLVSLRAETSRGRESAEGFSCEARILKDKRWGPGWSHTEVCRGPDGLC